jgi:predicted ribonuclease YlaK
MTKRRTSNPSSHKLKDKIERGEERIINKKESCQNTYNLGWFKPSGLQHLIPESIDENDLTIVDAPSGCGKSSTVLWKGLNDYSNGIFKHILLIKNPTECGDDNIGFLPSNAEDKISVHMEAMKSIFYDFIPKQKLENDISNGNIILSIPNFQLGKTFYNTLIILEEAQTMSPNTIKFLCERCGEGSKVVVVGDSKQRYSVRKREDGFNDLIKRVTFNTANFLQSKYKNVGYIRMETNNNMRSSLSRFITEIYE